MFVSYITVTSQEMTEVDIKEMTKELNGKFNSYEDPITGIKGKGVSSLGRKIIFQYTVPNDWMPNDNLKEDLIMSLFEVDDNQFYVREKIDLGFYYFKDFRLVKSISVGWKDIRFRLGDYLDLSNHEKSNGLEYKIRVPLGWKVEEGAGPHIVKKFTGGGRMYLIFIDEFGQFFSREEVFEFMSDDSTRLQFIELMFEGVDFDLDTSELVVIEQHPFIYFTGTQKGERMGIKMNSRVHYWVTLIEDQVFYLGGTSLDGEEYFPDFFKITNSLKLISQY